MQNPFELQLRSCRPGPVTGLALEAPLPLGQDPEQTLEKGAPRCVDCPLGAVQIVAATGPGRDQALLARPWISLLYVVHGEIAIVQAGRQIRSGAGGCLLIPQLPVHWQSEAFSVVCLMLLPQRLAALMHASAPNEPLTARDFQPEHGVPEQALIELLAATLRAVATLQIQQPHLLDRLDLADQLGRLIAALAALSASDQHWREQQRRQGTGMQQSLDALIAFIQANLDQPLNLAVLENHTHYSRRALQYAFRERLGCTASQWIRSQRLDLAYQQLQQAEAGDSVSRIALRCGYHSLSLFSIDFQQRFHIKPSHLLREGRQPGC